MSRIKVLAVAIMCVLTAGLALAEQGSQSSMQGSQQGMGSTGGVGSSQIQQLSQQVQQSSFQLNKVIQTAERQAHGKAIGAAFVTHSQSGMGGSSGQSSGSSAGQASGSTSGQDQNVVAHVYVFADNQIKDVIVDPKANKVQDTQNRQMLSNPWMQSQMGTSGSSGAGSSDSSSMQGQSSSGQSGSTGMDAQTDRTGVSVGGQMLTLTQAQQISRLVDQQNATLDKAIDKAKSQAPGQVIGAFFVLQGQQTAGQQQQSSQQGNLVSKVYVVDTNNQLKVVTLDAKADKVQNVETQQTLSSPWQSRMGVGSTSGMQQQDRVYDSGQRSGNDEWPTGSSGGSGQGTLGGQERSSPGSGGSSGQQGGNSGY